MNEQVPPSVSRPRGLAALSPERRREIARQGGRCSARRKMALPAERRREIAQAGARALHARGLAHQWTSEEAAAAGQIGGTISRPPARKGHE